MWQWLPFVVVLLMAGLRSFAREPFEAAQLDGASAWSTFRFITLPLLQPVIAVVVLFRAIDSFKVFDVVAAYTGGGPGTATNFMSWLIYQTGLGINENLGLSAGYALLFLLPILVISWTLMYVLYRLVSK